MRAAALRSKLGHISAASESACPGSQREAPTNLLGHFLRRRTYELVVPTKKLGHQNLLGATMPSRRRLASSPGPTKPLC